MNATRRILALMLGCTLLIMSHAVAQKSSQQTKPAKENLDAVWTLQAQCVAEQLGLTKDQTASLATAYCTARTHHRQSLEALPEETEKDNARAAQQAVVVKDQADFLGALKGTLSDDIRAKLTNTLGSFNTRWDGYTATLQKLNLNPNALRSAMGYLIAYVSDYETASKESMKAFNRRPNSRAFKEKLDAQLAGVLNADQLKAWNEATARTGSRQKPADPGNN